MFVWRACNEALPTMSNLMRRKVLEDSNCPICHIKVEISGHVLWDCEAAKEVWSQGCRKVQKMSLNCSSFQGICGYLVNHLQQIELVKVAMITRLLWSRRNDFIHGK